MKKTFALLLASALSLGALAGCTPAGSDEDNVAPVISGVANTATTVAGEAFDALQGVTASDAEDGDLTESITVESIPDLTFTDGVATPSMPGSYELIYSVVDSDGAEGNAYCTLTVTRAASETKELYSFDFSDVTPAESDKRGWTASIDESVDGTAELRQGAYVFDIASLGTAGDGSVTLNKVLEDPVAGDYEIFVFAKSTVPTYMHVIAEDASTDDWKGIGGGYNLRVGETIRALSAKFTLGEDNMTDAVDLRIHMGRITPNPEAPADTSADAFTLSIEKIALYCTTGTETRADLYSQDFSEDASSVTTQAGDGAAATVTAEGGAAKVDIASYHDDGAGGVWSLKVDLSLANVTIEEGVKYGYSLSIGAERAQAGELLVESRDAGVRANFNAFSVAAGETKTVEGVFTAEAGIATDGVHGNARITSIDTGRIRQELAGGKIVVVAGFQGRDPEGDITTLGRGGSDTTAVALAGYLRADKCQIFTDVDGVYDRDPRLYPDAIRFGRIPYDAMLELIENGAQVLHDRSVELAREYGIVVEVLSAFTGEPGTLVGDLE